MVLNVSTNLNEYQDEFDQQGITQAVSQYFQFLFAEMKLQPHSIQRYPSTVADCLNLCAGRCIDRRATWAFGACPPAQNHRVSPTRSDELNDGISAPLATIQRGIYYRDADTVELMPELIQGGGP